MHKRKLFAAVAALLLTGMLLASCAAVHPEVPDPLTGSESESENTVFNPTETAGETRLPESEDPTGENETEEDDLPKHESGAHA